jgi:hypothetical protein
VRRDWLRGGVRLFGSRGTILNVPATLADDARSAIASQRGRMVRASSSPDDPTRWMP